MPYIRLYSREVPLAEKRLLAEKLISIALDAFGMQPDERYRISVQFVPRKLSPASIDSFFRLDRAAAVLEVCDNNLTVHKVTAFVEAATPVLSQSAAAGRTYRAARMLGFNPDPSRQIAFQFNETRSPSGDSFGDGFTHLSLSKAA